MSQAASTSTSGNVNINDAPTVNPWLIGGGIVALVFIIWLFKRK